MIYVMSDIHGHIERFNKMLGQINFGDKDTLYILGDVIDRNPFGISLLRKIMGMKNVKMLLGNHEYMMLEALGHYYEGENYISYLSHKKLINQWYSNGGKCTHLSWNITPAKVQKEILDYLSDLPLNIDTEVNGKKYKLIHAAPEELYGCTPHEYEMTKAFFCVWDRDTVFDDPPKDCTIILGHTPTWLKQKCDPLEIWHSDNLIDIDCGCGHENNPDDSVVRLACLRLEDMKEFYTE